jgi:hypothetical protein
MGRNVLERFVMCCSLYRHRTSPVIHLSGYSLLEAGRWNAILGRSNDKLKLRLLQSSMALRTSQPTKVASFSDRVPADWIR